MTDDEMLREFEMGRVVKFRGSNCRILGIEFHGRMTASETLVFLLAPEETTDAPGLAKTYEGRADECARVRKFLAA